MTTRCEVGRTSQISLGGIKPLSATLVRSKVDPGVMLHTIYFVPPSRSTKLRIFFGEKHSLKLRTTREEVYCWHFQDLWGVEELSSYYRLNLFSAICLNSVFFSCFPRSRMVAINISSILALQPLATFGNYCGGKAARLVTYVFCYTI